MTTVAQLARLTPALEPFADAILASFTQYGIITKVRQEMFLAQYAHETGGFKRFTENLNYSADGLLKTFPKYFHSMEEALGYAHQPNRIANIVYAGRMGNGPEASGDGWTFRGRGFPQLTGRGNYGAYSSAAYGDDTVLKNPDLLLAPPDCVGVGGWFWQKSGCNELADPGTDAAFAAVTRRINGGLNGLDDRKAWWEKAMAALSDMS